MNTSFLDQLRAAKVPEEARRVQSPSLSHAIPGTSRGHTHRRQASPEPRQAVPKSMPDISAAVRAKVTSRMRSAPILGLAISDENLDLRKRPSPSTKQWHEIRQSPNSWHCHP